MDCVQQVNQCQDTQFLPSDFVRRRRRKVCTATLRIEYVYVLHEIFILKLCLLCVLGNGHHHLHFPFRRLNDCLIERERVGWRGCVYQGVEGTTVVVVLPNLDRFVLTPAEEQALSSGQTQNSALQNPQ
jgi:hypothetical protein